MNFQQTFQPSSHFCQKINISLALLPDIDTSSRSLPAFFADFLKIRSERIVFSIDQRLNDRSIVSMNRRVDSCNSVFRAAHRAGSVIFSRISMRFINWISTGFDSNRLRKPYMWSSTTRLSMSARCRVQSKWNIGYCQIIMRFLMVN